MKKEILIVLGSPNSPLGKLSDISKSRLDYCETIFTTEKLILLTGGWGKHFNTANYSHATYAKEYLIKKGIKEHYFLEVALSKSTVDDAVKIKPIISKFENFKLIIITSSYHLERAKLVFKEILENDNIEFVGVEYNLEKEKFDLLAQHEKKAMNSILEKGLYY